MYIIQYDRVFNTDCFGALKMDEREIIFYTPGMSGKVPKSSEDNSIYFFREGNVKAAFGTLIDALCDGQCRAIRLEEKFGLQGVEKTKEPGLLVVKFL